MRSLGMNRLDCRREAPLFFVRTSKDTAVSWELAQLSAGASRVLTARIVANNTLSVTVARAAGAGGWWVVVACAGWKAGAAGT